MFPSGETNGTTGQAGEFEPDMTQVQVTDPERPQLGRAPPVFLNILLDFHTGGM
jgi:hypothetical protein